HPRDRRDGPLRDPRSLSPGRPPPARRRARRRARDGHSPRAQRRRGRGKVEGGMKVLERAWRATKADLRLHVLSVFSVAVAFVCLAAALLVVVNIDAVRQRWEQSGRASVYLRSDATSEQVEKVRAALSATPGVGGVRFVSSEEARREVLGASNDDVLTALPPEAFPASLEFELQDDAASERIAQLSEQLRALPYVEAVETYEAWGERLKSL